MNPQGPSARVIRCPVCGADSVYSTDNPYRPFCSARCKNNDLGAWASEDYAVPDQSPQPPSAGGTDDDALAD